MTSHEFRLKAHFGKGKPEEGCGVHAEVWGVWIILGKITKEGDIQGVACLGVLWQASDLPSHPWEDRVRARLKVAGPWG